MTQLTINQHVLHVTRQVCSIPSTAQRFIVSFLSTQLQSLVIFLPLYVNLNLEIASTHGEQLLQVDGHCSLTPSKPHLMFVDLFATQVQSRVIFLPSSLIILNRNGESSQSLLSDDGDEVGMCDGGKEGMRDGDKVGVDEGEEVTDAVGDCVVKVLVYRSFA